MNQMSCCKSQRLESMPLELESENSNQQMVETIQDSYRRFNGMVFWRKKGSNMKRTIISGFWCCYLMILQTAIASAAEPSLPVESPDRSGLILILGVVLLAVVIIVLRYRKNARKDLSIKLPPEFETPSPIPAEIEKEDLSSLLTKTNSSGEQLYLSLEGNGNVYEARGEVIRIGRLKENQISISANEVSREHVEVTISNCVVHIRALTESNTTRVNGRTVKGSQALKPGDTLNLGGIDFVVLKARPV